MTKAKTNLGGEDNDWGNRWISDHAAACVTANKPCLLEEYGTRSNHVAVESPWQKTALSSQGIAADLFWQWGDQLSSGQTSNDGNTIYDGTSDYQALAVGHVADINGGSHPPPTGTTATMAQTQPQQTPTPT
jgi:mannan endo-1,4-beta-mannosidase